MMSQKEVSTVVCVELSQFEGRQLATFLDGLIERSGNTPGLDSLTTARDKLEEANSVAQWLRENVALELPPAEAQAVLDTLPPTPDAEAQTAAALADVREKLSRCLSRRVASKA